MRFSNFPFSGKPLAVLVGLAAFAVSTPAQALFKIYSPSVGQRLEPGEPFLLEYTVDANMTEDEYNKQIRLEIKRGAESPWEELEVLEGSKVLEPEPESYGSRPGSYMWTVPEDLSCAYCQLKLTSLPGRGDYDATGTMTFSVGQDFVFFAPAPGEESTMIGSEVPAEDDVGELPANADEPGELPSAVDDMPAQAPIRGDVDVGSEGMAGPNEDDDQGGGGCSWVAAPVSGAPWALPGFLLGLGALLRRRRRVG